MKRQSVRQVTAVRAFQPRRALWRTAWIVFCSATLPVIACLYFFTIPTGRYLPFVVAHVVLTVLFAAAAHRLRSAGVWLAPDGIRERAYFGRLGFVGADRLASVLVVPLHDTSSTDVSRQVFFIDDANRTVLRLRGQLWATEDLDAIIGYFGLPVVRIEPALTWPELRRAHGSYLDAFERHPVITVTVITAAFLLIAVPSIVATMHAIS